MKAEQELIPHDFGTGSGIIKEGVLVIDEIIHRITIYDYLAEIILSNHD